MYEADETLISEDNKRFQDSKFISISIIGLSPDNISYSSTKQTLITDISTILEKSFGTVHPLPHAMLKDIYVFNMSPKVSHR